MTRTYLPYLCQHLHESVGALAVAWVRPTGRAGALQGEVFDKASRGKRRAREARAGARGAAKGRRGAALRRLSCNRSTEAVAQTLLSRLEPKKLLSLNLLSHRLF